MAKRQMVQANLIKNSIAAYMAAIELHNKPNISYRYETVTLLMMNAWELVLKAFVKKYIKNKSIYENDGHTIRFDKALSYVNEYKNGKKKKSFLAVKSNLEEIEVYRNNVTHYYCDELEPYIFMLVAKAAINYVEFMKTSFDKDIMANAVANSIDFSADESILMIYMELLEKYTVWHLQVLSHFANPARGIERGDEYMGGADSPLYRRYPHMRERTDLVDKIVIDLQNEGMLSSGNYMHCTMTNSGMYAKRTTKLGDDFIQFISS